MANWFIKGPPRPGLIPASGDPNKPYRWVRPGQLKKDKHPGLGPGSLSVLPTGIKASPVNRMSIDNARKSMGILEGRSDFLADVTAGWERSPKLGVDGQTVQAAVANIYEGSPERATKRTPVGIPTTNPKNINQATSELKDSMNKEHAFWKSKLGEDGTIRLYRGLVERELPNLGQRKEPGGYPANSWTTDPEVAARFGNVVIAQEVPIDYIVASSFSLLSSPFAEQMKMKEFIVYNPPNGSQVEVVMATKLKLGKGRK